MTVHDADVDEFSRSALLELQWDRLKTLIEAAYHNSDFWRERLDAAGVTPGDLRTLDDYTRRVPLIGKDDLLADQNDAEPYGRRLAVPIDQIRATYLTSGSSGKQQEVHAYTADDLDATIETWWTSLRWGGVQPGHVGYLMVPIGLTAGPVSLFNAYQSYGMQTFAVGALDGEERLNMMTRFSPHFFSCSPIYLRRLTRIAQQMDIVPQRDLPDLQAIKLGTYGYTMEWVREVQDFWGATLIDNYASTQAGVGSTCEGGVGADLTRRAMIHMLEHRVLFEVLDPDSLEPVADGEVGEAVVTPIDRRAMPLLRFRTGDRVRKLPYTYCSCGRPYGGIESGTITRYDNMLKVRGMNLWTDKVDELVLQHPVSEYNGLVYVDEVGREHVEVHVLVDPSVALTDDQSQSLLAALGESIKAETSVKCEVILGTSDSVRQINYKERRWQDLRKETM